jgi:hypothetical protein
MQQACHSLETVASKDPFISALTLRLLYPPLRFVRSFLVDKKPRHFKPWFLKLLFYQPNNFATSSAVSRLRIIFISPFWANNLTGEESKQW